MFDKTINTMSLIAMFLNVNLVILFYKTLL